MILVFFIFGFRPEKYFDFFLENALVTCMLIGLAIAYRRLPLSDLSYLCIFLFLCLHEWGAHYKYSDVPLGEWMKPLLHTTRNHYDRVAHFSYGLAFSYPFQEVCIRTFRMNSGWRYYIPIECTLAVSAVYEIMEMIMANILTPERGEEFVGMQGDIWDSQEDMLMAGLGSCVAMLIIYLIRRQLKARAAAAASREVHEYVSKTL